MAKEKDQRPGLTELTVVPAAGPELLAALAEVARLKALLAAQGAAPPPAAPVPGAGRRFRVKLKDCAARGVVAADSHEAEKVYRAHAGIRHTVHEFENVELPPDWVNDPDPQRALLFIDPASPRKDPKPDPVLRAALGQ